MDRDPTRILWAVGVLLTAGTASGKADQGLLLADNGQAIQPIVISPKASDAIKAVANELAGYLSRITAAKFEVKIGDGSHGLVLGTIAEFPDPALTTPLEFRNGFDGRETFTVRTDPKRVRLAGATNLGASHAALAFVESLGCRWFFPAPEWEVVPSIPTSRADRIDVHSLL